VPNPSTINFRNYIMISFKSFVNAIHDAIMNASDSLMDKNVGLLEKYFEQTTTEEVDNEGNKVSKETLKPRTVILEYPSPTMDPTLLESEGIERTEVQVPLITLVPLQMSQIKKAVFSADFEIEIVDDEIQLHFPNKKNNLFKKKPKTILGKLEVTISPMETSEGLRLVVEGYESMLKRQIH
jgi:hypothetical protein